MAIGVNDRRVVVIISDQPETKITFEDDPKPKKILDLVALVENNTDQWKEIIDVLNGIEIEDEDNRRRLARQATRFHIIEGNLYKKSMFGPLLTSIKFCM